MQQQPLSVADYRLWSSKKLKIKAIHHQVNKKTRISILGLHVVQHTLVSMGRGSLSDHAAITTVIFLVKPQNLF